MVDISPSPPEGIPPMPPGRRRKLSEDAESILALKLARARWASARSNEDLLIEIFEANDAGMPYAAIGRILGISTESARLMGVEGEQTRNRRVATGPDGAEQRRQAYG